MLRAEAASCDPKGRHAYKLRMVETKNPRSLMTQGSWQPNLDPHTSGQPANPTAHGLTVSAIHAIT